MKKILVTGGAGFLGSHLCERLLNEKNQVICLDNLQTGSLENVRHLETNSNFRFMKHDIVTPFDLQIDEIYNMACPASPVHYQANPMHTTKTSVLGILNLLALADKYGAKILHASTSEVYGDPLMHPQKESYWGHVNPIGIRACYDEGKRCAETLMMDSFRMHKTRIKIVRIFNTYGPRMAATDGRVVSNFIVQALKGEDITIYGKGEQTRSFCFYSDLIEVIVRMMASDDSFLGPVNIGNPVEFNMLELAEKVLKLTGAKSKLVYKPLPADDPTQRRPDISLAKAKLDWEPKVALQDGLQKTIEYFRPLV
jgi:UDP-glucuronate decarboxylase